VASPLQLLASSEGERHVNLQLRHVVAVVGFLQAVVACDDTVTGQKPVGGSVDTEAEIQRYQRRVYLDLSGKPPADDELAASTTRLQAAGNTPSARAALVDELMAKPAFATVWIEELENSIFGGNTLADQYALVCGIIRGTDPTCNSCTSTDSCACNCSVLPAYLAERDNLQLTTTDFGSGTQSSKIERRYALAAGYYVLAGSPEGRVRTLFEDFLGRTAEADEVENGRSMIFGAILPGSPAGLLFHKHGASYDDLVDIVFTSEVYREAIVRRIFDRYLSRSPIDAELEQFSATLDATDPDARDLVHAVLSSREYFEQ
jgi:hypothetical protein